VTLEILEPGALTTVQDLGRIGYQRLGVPTAGAMDPFAFRAANVLAGNDAGAAALEITIMGPSIRLGEGAVIAVAGADLGLRIDGREADGWRAHMVRSGSVIDFAGRRSGARAYLAVAGGVALEPWLGSQSTYMMAAVGGLEGRALRAGDRLPVGRSEMSLFALSARTIPVGDRPPYSDQPVIRVILGPHADRFTEAGISTFLSGSYEISPVSNRMGYRLDGPEIEHVKGADIISCGIPLGGIQVPGNGQPIVLMADHQTTGGYTMIATVIQADIPLVAQCLPGERLRFRAVELEEARDSYRRMIGVIEALAESGHRSLWEL
jgi:antagonist of KipI